MLPPATILRKIRTVLVQQKSKPSHEMKQGSLLIFSCNIRANHPLFQHRSAPFSCLDLTECRLFPLHNVHRDRNEVWPSNPTPLPSHHSMTSTKGMMTRSGSGTLTNKTHVLQLICVVYEQFRNVYTIYRQLDSTILPSRVLPLLKSEEVLDIECI